MARLQVLKEGRGQGGLCGGVTGGGGGGGVDFLGHGVQGTAHVGCVAGVATRIDFAVPHQVVAGLVDDGLGCNVGPTKVKHSTNHGDIGVNTCTGHLVGSSSSQDLFQLQLVGGRGGRGGRGSRCLNDDTDPTHVGYGI
mgnify:FL=1